MDEKMQAWTQTGVPAVAGPIVRGGLVYVAGPDRVMRGVEAATRKVPWDPRLPEAVSAPPRLLNGRLYVPAGKKLVCLDPSKPESEAVVFEYAAESVLEGTPGIAADGSAVYIGDRAGLLHAVSLEGKELWKLKLKGKATAEPVSSGAMLFVACQDRHVYAYKVGAPPSEEPLWAFATEAPNYACPVLGGSALYVVSGQRVYAVSAETGKELWQEKVDGEATDTPVLSGKVLYVPGRAGAEGRLYALDTNGAAEGRLLWTFKECGPVLATPLADGGRIIFGSTDETLYAVGEDGKPAWKYRAGGVASAGIRYAPARGTLDAEGKSRPAAFVVSDDGVLHAVPLWGE
jgi:outer membrane protein assembly factor BamB